MSNKHLKCAPHMAGKRAWWYEEVSGIKLIAEWQVQNGVARGTTLTHIKWADLRAALELKDRK